MAAIAGFNGRVIFNGVILRAYHWSIEWHGDPLDVTQFESNGIGTYILGVTDADVSFDAYFDTLDNPFAAPVAVFPGLFCPLLIRYTKAAGTLTWTFVNVLVTSARSEAGVRDTVRYTVTCKNSGISPVAAVD